MLKRKHRQHVRQSLPRRDIQKDGILVGVETVGGILVGRNFLSESYTLFLEWENVCKGISPSQLNKKVSLD